MPAGLLERIYEAAFVPEFWESVIADIAVLSGSVSGAMLLVDPRLPPLWVATPNVHEQLDAYSHTDGWFNNPRMLRLLRAEHAGFVREIDVSTPDEIKQDPHVEFMTMAGLEHQAATGVTMPTGELVMFTVERAKGMEHFADTDIAALDALRPHLARASLMAVQLQLRQARSTVETLQSIGLPAAVLAANGAVMATNPLFELEARFLRPSAFGRLSVADKTTNDLLQDALSVQGDRPPKVRSVPIKAQEYDDRPAVVHVVPLRRAAQDILGSGTTLIVVTSYSLTGRVPADAILKGLFDLSAAETKLAAALASGQTLKAAAAARLITIPTARSQLAQIFHKTGTHQQSELVALLKSAHPAVDADEA